MSLLPVGQTDVDRTLLARLTWRDWRPTLVAAGLSAAAVAIFLVAFESVSAFERPVVLASLTTSILFIASALIAACGTIAALMLTAVSLLDLLETRRLPPRMLVHLRLTLLGALSTIALAVGSLLVTTFPVAGGVDVKPPSLAGRRRLFRITGIDGADGGDVCRGADLALCHGYRRPAGTSRDLGRGHPRGGHGPGSGPPPPRTPPLIHAWWPGSDRFSVARPFQQSAPAFMAKAGARR